MTSRSILFVCHGNICRSPMAEFVMKALLKAHGIEGWRVESAAVSTEEIGNGIHLLMAVTGSGRDVADPWYTGDFEETFQDVLEACEILLSQLS